MNEVISQQTAQVTHEERPPTVVDFPLRGEWVAAHTPGQRIPSHGTDQLGQRFAYDFLRIDRDRKGWKFFRTSLARYLLLGVRLDECYGWSEPIYAPCHGTVVVSEDDWPERQRLHMLRDLGVVLRNALFFNPGPSNDLRSVLGNHIIVKLADKEVYAFFAHARRGSIRVRVDDEVTPGQPIAEVGHSGNSTAPHLHFQLMDRASILDAKGLPCSFKHYQAWRDGTWQEVSEGIPGLREFIRYSD